MPSEHMRAVAEKVVSTWIRNPDGSYSKPRASTVVMRDNHGREGVAVCYGPIPTEIATEAPRKRIRQSAKPLLNKLETQFLQVLQVKYPGAKIHSQSWRAKLGNGIWYKPDFSLFTEGRMVCYEVKGPHAFRGGFENLKVAASLYPEVTWILVWKDAGQWREQRVLP